MSVSDKLNTIFGTVGELFGMPVTTFLSFDNPEL